MIFAKKIRLSFCKRQPLLLNLSVLSFFWISDRENCGGVRVLRSRRSTSINMKRFHCRSPKKPVIIGIVVVCLIVVAVAIVFIVVFTTRKDSDSKPEKPTKLPILPPPTGPPGADGPYKRAVVASDAGPCSEIGRDVLKRGGTAVDSAVAALFCIGVFNMHSAGVGGGGFMVVYKKSSGFVEVIDFREEAPGKANRTMYVGGKMSSRVGKG